VVHQISAAGVIAGVSAAVGLGVLVAVVTRRAGGHTFGPADAVTLVRAVLVAGVATLVADGLWTGARWGSPLVELAVVALVLDAVDGLVARRTGTATALGARLDMETDAALLLVLSAHVAVELGGWVLAIGLMRYTWLTATWALAWLRVPSPPRYSAKLVAAVQGVVLVVVCARLLPRPLEVVAVAAALTLLTWSFGHDLRRLRRLGRMRSARPRPVAGWATSVLSGLLVLVALTLPTDPDLLGAAAFARIPVEALVGVVVLVTLPARARAAAAAVAGLVLGLLTVLAMLDAGFTAVLSRRFDPVLDWQALGFATELLAASTGRAQADALLAAVTAVAVTTALLITFAVRRLAALAAGHRTATLRAATVAGAVWAACALLGTQLAPGLPVAAASAAAGVRDRVSQVGAGLRDPQVFATQAAADAYRDVPGERLLTGLRGKDVALVFVESYGRVALTEPGIADGVRPVLDEGTARLAAAGVGARSGWLTSPTTGGESWLAHATLTAGVWVDDQRRYESLAATGRLTLGEAFRRAGWRTAGVMPGVTSGFPEAGFYGYEQVHDAAGLGYRGPAFSWASTPDQYTLAAFQRLERDGPRRGPVMAEIPLVSSHAPWDPLPRLVGWDELGDGSVFATMSGPSLRPDAILTRDRDRVRADYRRAVAYSLSALVSYVQTYGDDELVLVVLGDHQPARVVTGSGASADVPVTIIARDPAVLARVAGWGWTEGLRPAPDAPVWPMDSFRDRFLAAFGP